MRSNEIAKLAGVTVRALRHYHAIGLLPEPPRGQNGYRDYENGHLARVFRIKQLSSLGFPLEHIGRMLDELDASADHAAAAPLDELDELDCAIQAEIERLEEQRRVIEQIKRERLDPDLPVRFARALKTLRGNTDRGIAQSQEERTLLLLAGHFYQGRDLEEFERLVACMEERGLVQDSVELEQAFDVLPETASEAERAALAARSVELLEPLLDRFDAENWDRPNTAAELLLLDFQSTIYNEAQNDVTNRVYQALERLLAQRVEDAARKPSTILRETLDPDATS